ncbi:MAG: PEP-CTERM sorting domain-containing protein [Gammaproteobacteria bacterium]|nr:PEP-CTERM sorting domain-containing protein [Gammaproteobacteria bacterium]
MLKLNTRFTRSSRTSNAGVRRSVLWTFAFLATVALPASAIPITINTAGHIGEAAIFSVTLFDGDFVANNTANISNFTTDAITAGAPNCTNGCQNIPPFRLDDTNLLGEFTQNISALGNFIRFDLTFANAFDNLHPSAVSDTVIGELLNLVNFHTDLTDPLAQPIGYQDAVFVANLASNRILGATGITTVPEPGSLVLFASGLALLSRRAVRSALKHPALSVH